jgi:hypothetical protein
MSVDLSIDFEDCDHKDTETVEIDEGYPDATIGDYRDNWVKVEQCISCKKYYNEYEDKWEYFD